jgi:hypothetical protein
MINAIVTKLNSQLPDATLRINNIDLACDSRKITIDYSVYNANSTAIILSQLNRHIYKWNIDGHHKDQTASLDGVENNKITLIYPTIFKSI